MITCPVCENTQAHGEECENCGKRLVERRSDATPVTPLAELELTAIPLARAAAAAPSAPLPELERHHAPAVSLPPSAPTPELERTAHAKVAAVAAEPMPDLAVHRAPVDTVRAAPPTDAVTCRYCRNVQTTGMFCDRCGMRLSRVKVASAGGANASARAGSDEGFTRCPRCRQVGAIGSNCKECGTAIVPPEN